MSSSTSNEEFTISTTSSIESIIGLSTSRSTEGISSQSASVPLSEQTPASPGAASTPSSIPESSTNDSGMNQATLIGISVGSAVLLVLLLILFIIMIRRRRALGRKAAIIDSNSEKRQSMASRAKSPSEKLRKSIAGSSVYKPVTHSSGHNGGYNGGGEGLTPILREGAGMESGAESIHGNWRNSVLTDESTVGKAQNLSHALQQIHESSPTETTPLDPFAAGYVPPPSPTPSEYVIVDPDANQSRALDNESLNERRSIDTARQSFDVPYLSLAEKSRTPPGSPPPLQLYGLGINTHRRQGSGASASLHSLPFPTPSPIQNSATSKKSKHASADSALFAWRGLALSSSPQLRGHEAENDHSETPVESSPMLAGPSSWKHDIPITPIKGKHASLEPPQHGFYALNSLSNPGLHSESYIPYAPSGSPRKIASVGGHKRMPSSPSKPSFFTRHRGSSSVTSLQHKPEYEELLGDGSNTPQIRMRVPTMTDASVYDFDIYKQPNASSDEETVQGKSRQASQTSQRSLSPGPSLTRPNPSFATNFKRFSASMSNLPESETERRLSVSLQPRKLSQNDPKPSSKMRESSDRLLSPPPNLYIPRESLDLPPTSRHS